jgi:hypothetical protein
LKINSETFNVLRKYNKKAGKHRNIRVSCVVETKRGLGIVTYRKGTEIQVAHEPDRQCELLWCYRYTYDIEHVNPSAAVIDHSSKLYRGAWQWILDGALSRNQDYEIDKHRAIVNELSGRIAGKTEKRAISTPFSSSNYVRFIGEGFDFEINISRPFIPDGDRVLFAIGKGGGYITDMNGHGRIYRRPITDNDIKYGLCKYAAPQQEADE